MLELCDKRALDTVIKMASGYIFSTYPCVSHVRPVEVDSSAGTHAYLWSVLGNAARLNRARNSLASHVMKYETWFDLELSTSHWRAIRRGENAIIALCNTISVMPKLGNICSLPMSIDIHSAMMVATILRRAVGPISRGIMLQ